MFWHLEWTLGPHTSDVSIVWMKSMRGLIEICKGNVHLWRNGFLRLNWSLPELEPCPVLWWWSSLSQTLFTGSPLPWDKKSLGATEESSGEPSNPNHCHSKLLPWDQRLTVHLGSLIWNRRRVPSNLFAYVIQRRGKISWNVRSSKRVINVDQCCDGMRDRGYWPSNTSST